jgi:hypothetical protein
LCKSYINGHKPVDIAKFDQFLFLVRARVKGMGRVGLEEG